MSRWDYRYLGEERFPATLSAFEITHFFTLDEDELALVRCQSARERCSSAFSVLMAVIALWWIGSHAA